MKRCEQEATNKHTTTARLNTGAIAAMDSHYILSYSSTSTLSINITMASVTIDGSVQEAWDRLTADNLEVTWIMLKYPEKGVVAVSEPNHCIALYSCEWCS
jgi:hypothetical protein